jgi:hypothetical protein
MQYDLRAGQTNPADRERLPKMCTHRCLNLLLGVLLAGWAGTPAVQAQRQSHRPISTEFADSDPTEDLLARRLRMGRKGQTEDWSELQKLAEEWLKDAKFLDKVGKDLTTREGFDGSALKEMLEQITKDGRVNDNSKGLFRDFLDKAKASPTIPDKNKKLLERLSEQFKDFGKGALPKDGPEERGNDTPHKPPPSDPMSGPTPTPESPPSLDKDWQEQLSKLFRESADRWADPKWLDAKLGTGWRDSLATIAKRASEARIATSRLTNKARGLGRYLPRPSRFLPKSWTGPSPHRLSSMPRPGSLPRPPHFGGMSSPSAADMGRVVLWMGVLGLLVLVFLRASGWWDKLGTTPAAGWQLGPWPVSPGEVSTRGELVLAFEHLALLNLGPGALTCHHLDLAQRLAELPALDRDRRREAAGTLARLYEQARYTPDNEIMPPETMACARRELCYLAGVAA